MVLCSSGFIFLSYVFVFSLVMMWPLVTGHNWSVWSRSTCGRWQRWRVCLVWWPLAGSFESRPLGCVGWGEHQDQDGITDGWKAVGRRKTRCFNGGVSSWKGQTTLVKRSFNFITSQKCPLAECTCRRVIHFVFLSSLVFLYQDVLHTKFSPVKNYIFLYSHVSGKLAVFTFISKVLYKLCQPLEVLIMLQGSWEYVYTHAMIYKSIKISKWSKLDIYLVNYSSELKAYHETC